MQRSIVDEWRNLPSDVVSSETRSVSAFKPKLYKLDLK